LEVINVLSDLGYEDIMTIHWPSSEDYSTSSRDLLTGLTQHALLSDVIAQTLAPKHIVTTQKFGNVYSPFANLLVVAKDNLIIRE
jgi:hypothetical protein